MGLTRLKPPTPPRPEPDRHPLGRQCLLWVVLMLVGPPLLVAAGWWWPWL